MFGDPGARAAWFERLLHNALVSTMVGEHRTFEPLGSGTLTMLAGKRGVTVGAAAHLDAPPAPERLREAGYRLATLTNSAGLRNFLEQALSADDVKRLKPPSEKLGVTTGDLWLVAAHPWAVTGAANAGCRTAFVGRAGKVLGPAAPKPDVTGQTLKDVAEGILAVEALG